MRVASFACAAGREFARARFWPLHNHLALARRRVSTGSGKRVQVFGLCPKPHSTGVCRSPVYDSVEVDRAVVCLSSLGRGQFGRDTAWDGVSRAPEGLRRPVLGLRQLLGRMKKNLRMWRRKRKKRCGWVGKEDAAHLPLASSRAQTARWAAVRGGAASGGVGGRVDPSPAVRGAGTGRPTARCVARGKVSAAPGMCDGKAM